MLNAVDRVPLHPGRVQMTPVDGAANLFDMVRADEPSQLGTPINRRALQLLQADRRAYPVATGQSIQAGDVVDVQSDGTVGKTMVGRENREAVLTTLAGVTATSIVPLTEKLTICCTSYYTSPYYYGTAFLVSSEKNGDLSVGYSFHFASNSPTRVESLSAVRLSNTKFIVAYGIGGVPYATVGTTDGTSISFSSKIQIAPSYSMSDKFRLMQISDSRVLFVRAYMGVTAKVLTINGASISLGNDSTILGPENCTQIAITLLPDLNGNKRACVCVVDRSDGDKSKAVIATISGSNTVTWGTAVSFDAANDSKFFSMVEKSDGNIMAAYMHANSKLAIQELAISGSTIVPGTPKILAEDTPTYINLKKVDGGYVVFYNRGLPSSLGNAAYISADSLEVESSYTFNQHISAYLSAEPIGSNRFLLAYSDGGNSSYGTSTILEAFGDQIAGSFENRSSQAIALQSGTAGQSVEVIFDGVAELPGATAGQEITSPGVYGYCPEDGRIWVRPEWDVPYVMGSYVGTGTFGMSNPCVLKFDKPVRFILVTGGYTSSYEGAFFVYPSIYGNIGAAAYFTVEWKNDGKEIKWYSSTNGATQLNDKGSIYYVTAILR